MPNSKLRTNLLISSLLLLVIAVVACSSDDDSSSDSDASSAASASYETCEGFITAEHVEAESGTSGLIDRVRVLDIASIPGLAESGATANCLVEVFRTIDGEDNPSPGDSITLSLVRFETPELAASLYNSTLAAAILTAEQVGERLKRMGGIAQHVDDGNEIERSHAFDDGVGEHPGTDKRVEARHGAGGRQASRRDPDCAGGAGRQVAD